MLSPPPVAALKAPIAPTRNADAAEGLETADGSIKPGFCGFNNSCCMSQAPSDNRLVTSSQGTVFGRAVNENLMIYAFPKWLVMKVEPDREIGRRRCLDEIHLNVARRLI